MEENTSSASTSTSTSASASSYILDLPPMNSFQRLIFYQQIPLKYGETLVITKKSNGILCVKKVALDEESRAAALSEERAQFEKALEEQIGFRRVIDCIIEEAKPVVGHNCWVDLLHFHQKFIDNNLSPNLTGFKEEILKIFPLIIDTKYLARLVNIKDTSLGDLTELSKKYPEVSFYAKKAESGAEEESTTSFHDAGFDAICTGKVFLTLLSHFLRPKDLSESPLNDSFLTLLQNETLCNKLNVLQSDYAHLDLKSKELEPDRSNVLYIYDYPSSNVSVSDLQTALQVLLKAKDKISCQIYWLNEGSACFVQFEQAERAKDVISATISSNETETETDSNEETSPSKSTNILSKIKILTYSQYQEKRDKLMEEEQNQSQSQSQSKKRPRQ